MNFLMNNSDYKPWGKSISIDLFDCDVSVLSNPTLIQQYVSDVVKLINMVAHGPCHIERFGYCELEGYSAMQFIETSSITVHCDEPGKRAFIDIFSCKDFDGQTALDFSKNFFKAGSDKNTVLTR